MAPQALEAGQPSHEGDAASNQQLYALIDEACPLAYELSVRLEQLICLVRFNPERMRGNLALSADVIASEHLMMVLADTLGRQQAHDKVHAAIRASRQNGVRLPELLAQDAAISTHHDLQELAEALDPARYTGRSRETALQAADLADRLARRLLAHPERAAAA